MFFYSRLCFFIGNYGFLLAIMGFHSRCWVFIGYFVFLLAIMGFYWYFRGFIGVYRSLLVIIGLVTIMGFYDTITVIMMMANMITGMYSHV